MGCSHSRENQAVKYSVPVSEPGTSESAIYRNPSVVNGLKQYIDAEPEIRTLHDAYITAFKKYPCNNFIGTREKNSDGTLGPYKYKTFSDIENRASNLGSGILNLGLNYTVKDESNTNSDFIIIWSKNREEWITTDCACVLYKLCLVPVYDTLGPETIGYIFRQTKASTIVTSNDHVEAVITESSKYETLKHIVALEPVTPEQKKQAEQVGLSLRSLDEVMENGAAKKQEYRSCKPEDYFTVNYTSGTTGLPKGVIVTHKSAVAAVAHIANSQEFKITSADSHISYLPLAHVLERNTIMVMTVRGSSVGFFGGDILKLIDDIKEFKPTIFVTVPRLLTRIHDKIKDGLSKFTGVKKYIAETAINTKLQNITQRGVVEHAVYDKLMFNKIKQALGGRVRLILTGSAPIEPNVQNFLRAVFSTPILDGYGLTESCGAGFVSLASNPGIGHVGGPLDCIEFKVVDVPEMEYTSKDVDFDGTVCPRGEICFRGPVVTQGYFKDPERTVEMLDQDGWAHTGDVGRINPDGSLSIIDRKKNIFKLSQGEYVAAEKVENAYITSKYVAEVFLYGDSMNYFTVCIVVPLKEAIMDLAKECGLEDLTYEELCKNKTIIDKVLADMNAKAKAQKVNSFELAKCLYLEPTTFADKNLLTPTLKAQRHKMKKYYADVIEDLYKKGSTRKTNDV